MAETADPRQGILESVSKHRAQIMGFAAMWIFVFHVRNEILLFDNLPKWSFLPYVGNVDIYFDNIGFNGVDMFLFLSGWGLYHAIKKHSLLVFYKKIQAPYPAVHCSRSYVFDVLQVGHLKACQSCDRMDLPYKRRARTQVVRSGDSAHVSVFPSLLLAF